MLSGVSAGGDPGDVSSRGRERGGRGPDPALGRARVRRRWLVIRWRWLVIRWRWLVVRRRRLVVRRRRIVVRRRVVVRRRRMVVRRMMVGWRVVVGRRTIVPAPTVGVPVALRPMVAAAGVHVIVAATGMYSVAMRGGMLGTRLDPASGNEQGQRGERETGSQQQSQVRKGLATAPPRAAERRHRGILTGYQRMSMPKIGVFEVNFRPDVRSRASGPGPPVQLSPSRRTRGRSRRACARAG